MREKKKKKKKTLFVPSLTLAATTPLSPPLLTSPHCENHDLNQQRSKHDSQK